MTRVALSLLALLAIAIPAFGQAQEAPTEPKSPFITHMKEGQYLWSRFKGTDVLGTDDQKVGDVSDLLFDKNGTQIEAYVVMIGGFLGMGAKDVGMCPSMFTVVPGDKSKNESDKLKAPFVKTELKAAAHFEPYFPTRATSGPGAQAEQVAGKPRVEEWPSRIEIGFYAFVVLMALVILVLTAREGVRRVD